TTITNYDHLAEIWSSGEAPGPTGRYAEVTRGQVQDYGGNVLFAGLPADCRREAATYRMALRLVPLEWHDVGEHVASDLPLWLLVTE
ncbi:MAG TPA: hypothetical protein VFU31_13380, partial [Candidatus Binatia bacterium]|nr:hypothetical protein [Candidatus Binatia bacterium]